jgi:hypothetical protein
MFFQTTHQLIHSAFVVSPVLLKALDLDLCFRQLLIELPELLLLLLLLLFANRLLQNLVLGDLGQRLHH